MDTEMVVWYADRYCAGSLDTARRAVARWTLGDWAVYERQRAAEQTCAAEPRLLAAS